jgi:ubiquinone/menaquinone biosynthesis C-methylase UbiE
MASVDEMVPPADMNFVGAGDFKEIGENFLRHFIRVGGLQKEDRILDVGCGIGRMAIPLTQYLDRTASYEGFDIVANGIEWCEEQITSRYPNFRFHLVSVKNNMYQPNGNINAYDYRFPYEDESFDFVFLTSVFTHMRPADMENYLSEVSRVLKTRKNCFNTHFLINEQARTLLNAGACPRKLGRSSSGYHSVDPENPETAIAYEENYVRACYRKNGLRIIEPIRYGYWCGRPRHSCMDYLDITIATKSGSFA